MSEISIQLIETFIALAECGSFTAAAKHLNITKSAVSQSIQLLENRLGVNLFIRTTRQVSLTEEAELFLVQCLRLREELMATKSFADQLVGRPSGTLRISSNQFFAKAYLIKIIKQYIQQYPKVNVEINIEERMPNMLKEKVDIVFGVNWQPPDEVVAKKIGTTRYIICASPDYVKREGVPKKVNELSEYTYIPHSARREQIVGLKRGDISFTRQSRLKTNDADLLCEFALAGFGIVALHEYVVKDLIKQKKLVELFKSEMTPAIALYAYYQKNRIVQPKVSAFIKLITEMADI